MGKIINIDCLQCTNRFEWDVTTDQICPRCQTLQSGDVGKILDELRKVVIPGQRPILNILEALNARLDKHERLMSGIADRIEQQLELLRKSDTNQDKDS